MKLFELEAEAPEKQETKAPTIEPEQEDNEQPSGFDASPTKLKLLRKVLGGSRSNLIRPHVWAVIEQAIAAKLSPDEIKSLGSLVAAANTREEAEEE